MKRFIFIYIVSAFSAALVTTTNATNVALNKPAEQSSVFGHYGASRAVDGDIRNGVDMDKNSCSHTNDTSTIQQAWWRVNLESTYSITTVAITYRHWFFSVHLGQSGAGRLAGFSIYVSNTTNWWDGVLCYHDNKTALPETNYTFYIFCRQSVFGQYVTIYNERNSTHRPTGYSTAAILELCEVEIQIPSPCSYCQKVSYPYCERDGNAFRCLSDCENGYYGTECTDKCTCHGNGSCYSDGRCVTCNPGYYPSGTQCAACDTSCGGNGACNQTGTCKTCNAGTYPSGTQCAACPQSCGGNGACDVSGGCIFCNPGTYKSGACPPYCGGDNQECNTPDGTCINGCKNGFHGRRCIDKCITNCEICYNSNICEKCSRGYFGTKCNNRCDGCLDASCNRGGNCTKTCIVGRHGAMCNLNCSNNCIENLCDRNTGNCTEGCVGATYGPHCNKICPSGCGGDTKSCDRFSGLCESCINGKFGNQCTLNCSAFCGGNRTCGLSTGHCAFCAGTMTGPYCGKQMQSVSEVPVAAIAGGIAAAVFVILIIIVAIIVIKRRKTIKGHTPYYSTTTQSEDDNVYLNVGYTSETSMNTQDTQVTTTTGSTRESKPKAPPKSNKVKLNMATEGGPGDKIDYYNSSNEYYNSEDCIGGIVLEDFKAYVNSKRADKSLIQEFDSIPYGELFPATVGRTEVIKEKNRFKTIFPYDSTRIILTHPGNATGYINANYIHGRGKDKKYIATQGPLKTTIVDFWSMVWQCNVGKIVMLTGLVEDGKNKCNKYWPDVNERQKQGRFTLSIIDERSYSYYTQREIKVEDNKSKQTRRVHHFHFTAWPDHDVTDPVLLVQFHKRVESKNSDMDGPLLVHCSAGVGRTGTYIGLDDLVHTATQTNRINVKDFVKRMRDCRMNMVQKQSQYVLLHETILEELQLPETTITMSDFPGEWNKILSDKRPINQQRIRKEFEKVSEMKRNYSEKDYSASTTHENKRKSRPESSMPLDRYRPYLMKYIKGRTDYINAIIVPSHTSVSGFFVTQTPLKDTVIDFWRLIHDHEITAIVHFDSDHNDKCEFYPRSNTEMENELFGIRSLSESKYDENISEREVVLCDKDSDKKKTIKLVSVELRAAKLPSSIQLIKAVNLVNNWQHGNNTGPCAVMSCDGTRPCDVFCAVMIAIESLSVDNEVNIFQIVHQLQIRRPEFFQDCDTYKLCYEAVNQYLTSENIYFN